jgi:hypothetical protein
LSYQPSPITGVGVVGAVALTVTVFPPPPPETVSLTHFEVVVSQTIACPSAGVPVITTFERLSKE